MTIELDGRRMTDRAAAHDHLQETLELPPYYGRNLDALYDLLTERRTRTTIAITHTAELKSALGPYGSSLLKTLTDASDANPALRILLY